jgi:argininosuccinate lyase
MKLWQKGSTNIEKAIEQFTVGNDRNMDVYLAPFDILGSIAHVKMLASVGLLEEDERDVLVAELQKIYQEVTAKIATGQFKLDDNVEDIHSQIEFWLTARVGEAGKKIHSARSRNDQVLVDVRLFIRHEITLLVESVHELFNKFKQLSLQHQNDLLPGYTHLQLAMPSSFGLWFGAYAESLVDDLITLHAAYEITNKNPLGSAAGYGSSFPINRTLTTSLLGFKDLNYNVVYAQMGRGRTEKIVAAAMANIAGTLSKFSMDACLFLNQHFAFISFPDALTTGSSIMPHKKNPDVFELIRSYGNRMQALPQEITLITTNLTSGYHRDLQLLKEHLFPAFEQLRNCINALLLMLEHIEIKKNLLENEQFKYLFSVEEVNKLVLAGVPFREAYQQVGENIEKGQFTWNTHIEHTHEGSIGNLCLNQIEANLNEVLHRFQFEKTRQALEHLLL